MDASRVTFPYLIWQGYGENPRGKQGSDSFLFLGILVQNPAISVSLHHPLQFRAILCSF